MRVAARKLPAFRKAVLLSTTVSLSLSLPASAVTPFVHESVDPTDGLYSSLALDAQGNPRISYYDGTNSDLKYAAKAGSSWTIETVDATALTGLYTALTLDAQGNPRISYYDGTNSDLKYAAKSGSSWTIETVDATGSVGSYTSIALDDQGNPRISCYDISFNALNYAARSGSSWTIETVDATADDGWYTSLALDAQDNPRISYLDLTNDNLKYAAKFGSSWIIEIIDATGEVGSYTSLALDAQGNPKISYYDVTNDDLKYASKSGSSWTIEIVDATGIVGSYTSLALDAQGNPRISYRDQTNGHLKYATRSASSWTIETVDATGYVGQTTSLALDAQGNPRISYRDVTNFDLKYTDSAVHLLSPAAGATWAVGSLQTIRWSGSGTVDLYLSVDGGKTFDLLEDNNIGNALAVRVPHAPTRFARVRIQRSSPFSTAKSDSFFTIDATIALLKFDAASASEERGVTLSWATAPGPESDVRYRLERASSESGAFAPIHAGLLDQGEYLDRDPGASAKYRLIAVNGLGEEYVLGETVIARPLGEGRLLAVAPSPALGGTTSVYFRVVTDLFPVDLSMYDVSGRRVRSVESGTLPAGVHTRAWDGRDDSGNDVAAGTYFVRLSWGAGSTATERLTVVR